MFKSLMIILLIINSAFCFTENVKAIQYKHLNLAPEFLAEYPQIDYTKVDQRHKEVGQNFKKCIEKTGGDYNKFKYCFTEDFNSNSVLASILKKFVIRPRYHELSFFTTKIKVKKENDFFNLEKEVLTFKDLCNKDSHKECMGESNFNNINQKALITYIYALFFQDFFEIKSINSKNCFMEYGIKNFQKNFRHTKNFRIRCLNSLSSFAVTVDGEKKYTGLYIGVPVEESSYLREKNEYISLYEKINSHCYIISKLSGDKSCEKNLKEIYDNGFKPVDNS